MNHRQVRIRRASTLESGLLPATFLFALALSLTIPRPLYAQPALPERPVSFGQYPCDGLTDPDPEVDTFIKEVCAYKKEFREFVLQVKARFAQEIRTQLEKEVSLGESHKIRYPDSSSYWATAFDMQELLDWIEFQSPYGMRPQNDQVERCYSRSGVSFSHIRERLDRLRAAGRRWRLAKTKLFEIIPAMLMKNTERFRLIQDWLALDEANRAGKIDYSKVQEFWDKSIRPVNKELSSLSVGLYPAYGIGEGTWSDWEFDIPPYSQEGTELYACIVRAQENVEHPREKWRAADFDALFGKPKPQPAKVARPP